MGSGCSTAKADYPPADTTMPAASSPPAAAASSSPTAEVDERLVRDAVKSFAALDVNGDGKLSLTEFRSGLGTLGMDPEFSTILFNSFDRDGDSFVDKKEFIASMAVMLHPTDQAQQVSLAFDAYDLNKDGKLEVGELRRVIRAIFATMEKMGISNELADADATAEELFTQMDEEKKGFVTKEDYGRLALANPELIKKIGLGNPRAAGRTHSRRRTPTGPLQRGESSSDELSSLPSLRSKKRGTTVSFGHDNWELVVQMMLAIRLSVGRALSASREQLGHTTPSPRRDASEREKADWERVPDVRLKEAMFEEVWKTRIPGHRGGKDTTIGFKDYAPLVFRRIRSLFGVSDREYMLSLGPEQILGELLLGTMGSLSELFSEGKSGSFFYFSNDGRYLIKTIPHRELTSLIRLLPQYVRHVDEHPHTLLPRFMGAHRLVLPDSSSKVHFIVMTNVFQTTRAIHERYDLKGSTLGRSAGAKKLAKNPDMVRKDNDLQTPFQIKPAAKAALTKQVSADLQFLREVRTMDYSMLVGVHYPDREPPEEAEAPAAAPPAAGGGAEAAAGGGAATATAEAGAAEAAEAGALDEKLAALSTPSFGEKLEGSGGGLAGGRPAPLDLAAAVVEDKSVAEMRAQVEVPPWVDAPDWSIESRPGAPGEKAVFFIGVIDILTAWTLPKSAENIVKTIAHPIDPLAVSCVPPHKYANRFENAMGSWVGDSTPIQTRRV